MTDSKTTKRCPRCQRFLAETAFSPSKRRKNGTHCRDCQADYYRSPEQKAKSAARAAKPEYKERQARYRSKPEYKARKAAYDADPDNRAKATAYRSTLEYKEQRADTELRRLYGLTLAQKLATIEAQSGCCALCGKPFGTTGQRRPHIDHDHTTGVVRGIIHGGCNTALGLMGDDLASVLKAAEYLKKAVD